MLSLISKKFKNLYVTGNYGIWHVFYGKKDCSIFRERIWLKHYMGYEKEVSNEAGYFRTDSPWSGVIFSLDNCQVFYQNPWSVKPLSLGMLETIARLDGFDFEASWVDVDLERLKQRIELKLEEFEMMHELLDVDE